MIKAKYHPYKIKLFLELSDDFDRRDQYSEQFYKMNALLEATFTLHGRVNGLNCRYGTVNNPHWFSECHIQSTQK